MKHDFEDGAHFSKASVWSLLLSSLRYILKVSKLSVAFHNLRQLVHFGPWRIIPIYLIQKLRPPVEPQHESKASLLGSIDPKAIAREVRKNSVAIAGVLPSEFVSNLRKMTDKLPFNEYKLVHQANEDLHSLVEDTGIKNVLRAYFKCEPALLEASLVVSKPEQGLPQQGQNLFHFDYAGWESLNVFVYLTDVTENSSYHIVARGSHCNRSFRDVFRDSLTVEEGQHRFGLTIQNITGPAGTLFFENAEAYHRRYQGNERRVMLNILYASHRSLLSYGRASRKHIEARDREFKKLGALKNIV